MNKFMKAEKKTEEAVVKGYKAVEDSVVSGYKAIENAFVGGYKKIEDKFTETFLADDKTAEPQTCADESIQNEPEVSGNE